jgi:peptidoglycan/LPS O-acetylase OafA/YrhL
MAALARPVTFRGDIEGLRAVAVVLVLLDHAALPVTGGFVGVDVFFVISGYLITSLLLAELVTRRRVSLRDFYARRARRILPGAAAVLGITGVLTLTLLPSTRWLEIGYDMLASAVYVQNWRLAELAIDYQAQGVAASPVQHFWSLAVEEQFYILWPLLLVIVAALVRSRRLGLSGYGPLTDAAPSAQRQTILLLAVVMAAVAVSSFAWSIWYTIASPAQAYFVTTTRLWELAVGGALALLADRIARLPRRTAAVLGWAGIVTIVACAVLYTGSTAFPGMAALGPVLGTAAVIAAGQTAGSAGPGLVLDTSPMRWVGKLSYSLYLWHWPLVIVAVALVGHRSPVVGSIAVASSFLPAYLSYRFLENPVRRATRLRTNSSRSLALGGVCTATATVAAVVVISTMWPPATPFTSPYVASNAESGGSIEGPKRGAMLLADNPRDDPAGAPVDSVPSIVPDPQAAKDDQGTNSCTASIAEVEVRACSSGDITSGIDVALIGDSHAQHWATPLSVVAQNRKWKLTAYTKQGCPFGQQAVAIASDAEGGARTAIRSYTECAAWRDKVVEMLTANPPDMIIVSSREHRAIDGDSVVDEQRSTDLLVRGFRDVWSRFIAKGTKIVVIADTPAPNIPVPDCVVMNLHRLTKCTFSRTESNQAEGATLVAAARSTPGVTLIDLSDALCPTERCAPVIGGVLVWRDANHMSATYAWTLAPRLERLIPPLP